MKPRSVHKVQILLLWCHCSHSLSVDRVGNICMHTHIHTCIYTYTLHPCLFPYISIILKPLCSQWYLRFQSITMKSTLIFSLDLITLNTFTYLINSRYAPISLCLTPTWTAGLLQLDTTMWTPSSPYPVSSILNQATLMHRHPPHSAQSPIPMLGLPPMQIRHSSYLILGSHDFLYPGANACPAYPYLMALCLSCSGKEGKRKKRRATCRYLWFHF